MSDRKFLGIVIIIIILVTILENKWPYNNKDYSFNYEYAQ